ncbi:hypothetical protein LPB67_03120 [Undibacterium sp. Jales W-56]|uniref:hypothetical protein n=1 Tax=Undibacterium sp. Jales W-56 TaxID=2897325 RepID=UPI0021D26BEC|nr:hypothetical protein [Undibacterium sp. Jales W-56]MCU6432768.1 hypothetical protein [Undibacterium sp. Jales W-56]
MASSEDRNWRGDLLQLVKALRALHKLMIEVETQYYGVVSSPLEHLSLVTNHPHFAWLQKLSGMMVELDERLDDESPVDAATAMAFRLTLEQLIGPRTASDADFRQRYLAMLHDAPQVAIAHGELRRTLAFLPAPSDEKKQS